MTNEEAIELLSQEKIPMILDGKPNEHLAVAHIKAIEALEENTKLKAEIEQLNTQITESNREGISILHDILDLREENEKLKSQLNNSTTPYPKSCETCKYEDVGAKEEPCNTCVANGTNWESNGGVQ